MKHRKLRRSIHFQVRNFNSSRGRISPQFTYKADGELTKRKQSRCFDSDSLSTYSEMSEGEGSSANWCVKLSLSGQFSYSFTAVGATGEKGFLDGCGQAYLSQKFCHQTNVYARWNSHTLMGQEKFKSCTRLKELVAAWTSSITRLPWRAAGGDILANRLVISRTRRGQIVRKTDWVDEKIQGGT